MNRHSCHSSPTTPPRHPRHSSPTTSPRHSGQQRRQSPTRRNGPSQGRNAQESSGIGALIVGAVLGAVGFALFSYFSGSRERSQDQQLNGSPDHLPSSPSSYKLRSIVPHDPSSTVGRGDPQLETGAHSPQPPQQGQNAEQAESAMTCVVCLERRSVMVFTSCGHLCCCEECVVTMATAENHSLGDSVVLRCPQCRKRGPLQKVYLP